MCALAVDPHCATADVKLALSQISTFNSTFAEDVAAYAAAGFDAIGLWEFKLPPDDAANIDLLRAHGLEVANCVPTVPSLLQLGIPGMEGPAAPDERIASICASMRRLAAYEPESVLCLSGPVAARTEEEARSILVDGLRLVGDAARSSGVRLGFEPIHPSQRASTSFVNTVADAVALLAEAGLDDVGIMVDTFNLFGERPEDVAALGGRITGIHVADVPENGAPGERVLPSTTGRSAELVGALLDAGWDGSLEVEIFSTPEGFWSLPVEEAAQQAHSAIAALTSRRERATGDLTSPA